jgi:hypothetical protein
LKELGGKAEVLYKGIKDEDPVFLSERYDIFESELQEQLLIMNKSRTDHLNTMDT